MTEVALVSVHFSWWIILMTHDVLFADACRFECIGGEHCLFAKILLGEADDLFLSICFIQSMFLLPYKLDSSVSTIQSGTENGTRKGKFCSKITNQFTGIWVAKNASIIRGW